MSWQKLLAIVSAGLGAAAVAIPTGPLAIGIGIAAACAAGGAAAFSHGADKTAAVNAAVVAGVTKAVALAPPDHPAVLAVKAALTAADEGDDGSGHA